MENTMIEEHQDKDKRAVVEALKEMPISPAILLSGILECSIIFLRTSLSFSVSFGESGFAFSITEGDTTS